MVVFSGQLKKRTVNLGGGFKGNSKNQLLQQTQRQRERREQERSREKGAAVIVLAVERFVALQQFRRNFATRYELPSGLCGTNGAVFWFSVFYSHIYGSNPRRLEQIELLCKVVNEHRGEKLRMNNCRMLLKTVSAILPQLNASDETDLLVLGHILHLVEILVFEGYPQSEISENYDIIPDLTRLLADLYKTSTPSLILQITSTINVFSRFEQRNYLAFLTNSWILELPDFQITFESLGENLSNIETSFLDIDSKVTLLVNIIEKCPQNQAKSEWVITLAYIVSTFDVSLITRNEDQDADDIDDEEADSYTRKFVSEDVNNSLKKLYAREFISAASRILKGSHISALLYGSLIALKPNMKSTFVIYLIPNTFQPLLNSILENQVFREFTEINEDSLFNVNNDFIKTVFQESYSFLYYDLFIFLELLQYRLIISNDYEIFTTYDFTMEKFKDFAIFLKRFAFNLIWNHSKIKQQISSSQKLKRLTDLSVNVLSQVYLKDSRLQILAKDEWLLNENKLDISSLATIISQYELKKSESDNEGESYKKTLNQETQSKLKIFQKTPFFISFEKRVEIFQALVVADRDRLDIDGNHYFNPFVSPSRKQSATIRREHLLEDAFESFHNVGDSFKGKLVIHFTNEHGTEAGIDGGGITKEFLTSVVKEGFEGLFVENSKNELYPNPEIGLKYQYRIDAEVQLEKLNYINFMGKIIGKCLYERILVDVSFATFFLTKFNSGYKNSFDDLKSLDSELYSNLVKLLSLSEEELEALNLTFSIDERIGTKNITIDLIPNGSLIPVTISNRLKFIHEISNNKLNKLINLECNSFLNGMFTIISREWLSMFNPYELQMLISGEKDVNVKDLRQNTEYGGYFETDQTIIDFWEVVEEMSNTERFQLVKFVTSVPRAPLLGFKALVPRFGIRNVGETKSGKLPTSATCVNLLCLPNYKNKEVLKEKLLYAINAEARFDLA